jgi:hypothetical protein
VLPFDVSIPAHPNIAGLLAAVKTDNGTLVVHTYAKHTALSVSRFHANSTLSSPLLGEMLFLDPVQYSFNVFPL